MSEDEKIVSQKPKKPRKSRKPRGPKYWGLTWLTPKEAADKILRTVRWLLTQGIKKPYNMPYRPWGNTKRFIAEELDAWEGTEKCNIKKNPAVPKEAAINEKADKAWLTLKQAAKKLKVSVEWLTRVGIKIGIPYKKLGEEYRFIVEDIDNFPGFNNDTLKKEKKQKTQNEPANENPILPDNLMEEFNRYR